VQTRSWAWKLAVPALGLAMAAQLALGGTAAATGARVPARHAAGTIAPRRVNDLDCNGWGHRYRAAGPGLRMFCADPVTTYDGRTTRFYDNGHYVGHDEPSVKFISSRRGSGNTMTYGMRLPRDPGRAPTANGSVTHYAELSIAPWFGLPICDSKSFPQRPCRPDSDRNIGSAHNRHAAGSAFMELQFYPPGFTPFTEFGSCSATQYCAALNIDSLECSLGGSCNNNCIEPVNFSYLQTDGTPPGPPAPQDPNVDTWLGNTSTLRMNPGDVLKVSITDPRAGLTAAVRDLTTGQTGWIRASAHNGFANTNISDCSGTPHTFHAEYSTARKQNQVPWAGLEGGVLMEQEIGHFEPCNSVAFRDGYTASYSDGTSYADPSVYEVCMGGLEGSHTRGEGPCNTTTGNCQRSMTQGFLGPMVCPNSNFATSSAHCEFADGYCAPRGSRPVSINGSPASESFLIAACFSNQFQNGDLDFDGTSYRQDWPNGSPNFPESFRYVGPFTRGHAYSRLQFETDIGGSEQLCNVANGRHCTAPPIGARFYPFWSLTRSQLMPGLVRRHGACVWNFGNTNPGVTKYAFGRDRQYGKPNTARYGGTLISRVRRNLAAGRHCRRIRL
jgi:hypothetical protein